MIIWLVQIKCLVSSNSILRFERNQYWSNNKSQILAIYLSFICPNTGSMNRLRFERHNSEMLWQRQNVDRFRCVGEFRMYSYPFNHSIAVNNGKQCKNHGQKAMKIFSSTQWMKWKTKETTGNPKMAYRYTTWQLSALRL